MAVVRFERAEDFVFGLLTFFAVELVVLKFDATRLEQCTDESSLFGANDDKAIARFQKLDHPWIKRLIRQPIGKVFDDPLVSGPVNHRTDGFCIHVGFLKQASRQIRPVSQNISFTQPRFQRMKHQGHLPSGLNDRTQPIKGLSEFV